MDESDAEDVEHERRLASREHDRISDALFNVAFSESLGWAVCDPVPTVSRRSTQAGYKEGREKGLEEHHEMAFSAAYGRGFSIGLRLGQLHGELT